MLVIGIDPGTRCGWAVRASWRDRWEIGTMESGLWDLREKEGGPNRYVQLQRLLSAKVEEMFELDASIHVVYEDVRRHLGTTAAHVYGGLIAIIKVVCYEYVINLVPIGVGTVKKFATGKGNANKAQMMTAARVKWRGWDGWTDPDEADARWIAECGWALLRGPGHDDDQGESGGT